MPKNRFIRRASLLLAGLLLLSGCASAPKPPTDTSATDRETEATLSASETEGLTEATMTEETAVPNTDAGTETEEPEEEPADGLFDSATRLSGFLQSKNEAYLKTTACEITYNSDGTLNLQANAKAGARYAPKLMIEYSRMMMECYTAYTELGALPNAGENKYGAVVITVEGESALFNECDLYYTTGKRHTSEYTVLPTISEADSDGRTRLIFDMGAAFTEDYPARLILTWGYGVAEEDMQMNMKLHSIELFPTAEDAYAATGEAPPIEDSHGEYPLDISSDKIEELLRDIFAGNTVKNETVMFLDEGDEKELLFDIDQVISVTSYDGKKIYREGVDYIVREGKLVAPEGSSLPIITSERYYGADASSLLVTKYNGKRVPTHWGEGRAMTDWQVNVTYTHTDEWDGFEQPCEAEIYADFIKKLQNGEDVTVIFYGDSCTYGAASSFSYGYAPYQYSYALMVTNALADLFGYTVRYISPGLPDTGPIPSKSYVAGKNGTITYINPSVGGWGSADALGNADRYLVPFIEKFGCDLFISDIGGNDGSTPAETTRRNVEGIIGKVLDKADEDICVIIMSTLVNNPDSVNGWYGTEFLQEPQLRKAAAALRREGVSCGTCCVTSMTLSVLEHVNYRDISGNNINHPNDFWARMYACTLFEDLIGYDNLKS